ncbi:MAG TPA: ComEC/Rec2 family competence protein [Patescibacteria group bacterium]|nr:ComEC/Rec2 family competence protein [Patescibacteria group bacterium]
MNRKSKLFLSFLVSVIVLTFFLYTQFTKAGYFTPKIDLPNGLNSPIAFSIYYLDVGQGDSILIRTADGHDMLIDGGPDGSVLERLGEVLPIWDRDLDWVVLTHPHEDHIVGLDEILKRYNVKQILEPDLKNVPDNERYFNSLGQEKAIPEEKAIKGERIVLNNDVVFSVIYPSNFQMEEENLNDDSIIMQLEYKGKKFLFTGDATAEVEVKILDQNIDSDFLKIGHHGSRYSSSQKFLEAVTPSVSIISVGVGNSFGHPTQDTLDRLSAVGSRVLRTDRNGTIEVDVGENGDWQIECSKGCN